jgi:2-hydroxymuconate-semialdehyde hydrolase
VDTSTVETDTSFGLPDCWVDTAPGERTHYHDLGSGLPVVFLHGSGLGVSAAVNWWKNLPVVAKEYRALALDLLGFGHTVVPEGTDYGVHAWVDHVLRWADTLGLAQFWLVGNSLGGWVALQLAINHPERVLGIISMGTGGGERSTPVPTRKTIEELSADSMRRTLSAFVRDTTLVTDQLVEARLRLAAAPGARERYAAVVEARERDRATASLDPERLKSLAIPVLLVHGREDKVIPPSRSVDLHHLIPHSDLLMLANCGHWSQVERADDFNSAVLSFIRKWSHNG